MSKGQKRRRVARLTKLERAALRQIYTMHRRGERGVGLAEMVRRLRSVR